jgi:MOSC domain-containing protein YiiM
MEGRVMLKTLNLDGDRQADLTVHGGVDKAVYAYPIEHYEYWRKVFPYIEMSNGMFGENFTVEGLMESEVSIGDEALPEGWKHHFLEQIKRVEKNGSKRDSR